MPVYTYQARDAEGRLQIGTTISASAEAAAGDIRRRGWLIINIIETARSQQNGGGGSSTGIIAFFPFRRPRKRDLERSMRQISLMLRNGLTLLDALNTASDNSLKKPSKLLWASLAKQVEVGSTFADALALYPYEFPPLIIELARAGEQAGTLDVSLERGADHLERARELRSRVAQALFYPAIVLVLTFGVALIMFVKVLPEMEKFLQTVNRRLPPLTVTVLSISRFLSANIGTLSIITLAAIFAFSVALRAKPFRRSWDLLILKLPLVGTIRQLSNTVLFARSTGLLLSNGIGIVKSLELTEGILQNTAASGAVARARVKIINGSSMAEGMGEAPAFTPLLPKMIAIGERTGAIDRVLNDAAIYHESDLQRWIRTASALVEPAVTVTIGLVVGIVYAAFFLAIFAAAGG